MYIHRWHLGNSFCLNPVHLGRHWSRRVRPVWESELDRGPVVCRADEPSAFVPVYDPTRPWSITPSAPGRHRQWCSTPRSGSGNHSSFLNHIVLRDVHILRRKKGDGRFWFAYPYLILVMDNMSLIRILGWVSCLKFAVFLVTYYIDVPTIVTCCVAWFPAKLF